MLLRITAERPSAGTRQVTDSFRKLNLIDAMINADDHDPRAQHLGSSVLLFRRLNPFGIVELRDNDLWLSFYYRCAPPLRVTGESVTEIVARINNHRHST